MTSGPAHPGSEHESSTVDQQVARMLATVEDDLTTGSLARAEQTCREALQLYPGHPLALAVLGRVLYTAGRARIGLALLDRTAAAHPDDPAIQRTRGFVLLAAGQAAEAEACFRRALDLAGESTTVLFGLTQAQQGQGKHSEAIATARRAYERRPTSATVLTSLAIAELSGGNAPAAAELLRRATSLDSRSQDPHGCLLFVLNYLPDVSPRDSLEEARAWAQQHASPETQLPAQRPRGADRGRRLRVGYLSGDLGQHPVGRILEHILPRHDRSAFEIYCYSNRRRRDPAMDRLFASCDKWLNVYALSDEQLARSIRDDDIDILIDLSGHTADTRLTALSLRPARVSAMWLGYFSTTGMEQIDYLIGDRHVLPDGCEQYYVEDLIRLPHSFVCYAVPGADQDPEGWVRPDRPVTFGSFNNLAKISEPVRECWSRILRGVPTSRLVLKHFGLADSGVCDRVRQDFATLGVDGDRLVLMGPTSLTDHLEAYAQIDVALDTFPYSGGMTTLDALTQGVPVVTLAGDRFAGRMGLSILSTAGLPDLIAWSPEEYVAKAIELGTDLSRLAALRSTLRDRVAASPICDAELFTRELEAAYRYMWQKSLARSEPHGGG